MSEEVLKQLQAARGALISTGTRNPLVHFRRPAKSVAVGAVSVPALMAELLQEGRSFAFLPLPEEDLPLTLSKSDPSPKSGTLPTLLPAAKLLPTLTKMYREASTLLTEQGVHALYLGVGFLEWYESGGSDKKRSAPLLLIPVTLERKNVSSGYRMVYSGDDVMSNEPLALRLRQDFGIELPGLNAEELDPGQYLDAVESALGEQRRWVVHRDEVHLAFFSFTRYLMARDLEPDAWPAGKAPGDHAVIQALLGREGFPAHEALIGDGERLDRHIKPSQTLYVTDADSSQALAIHEVGSGRHLLIQGPPGTGKSQTITNLIAQAVGQGRTVLFVAEKMAALEVVQRRLTALGLGPLVLELHGHQTKRKAFVEQLRAARAAQDTARTAARSGDETRALDEVTGRLNAYAEELHTPLPTYGLTPYQAFGEWAALGEVQPPSFTLPAASGWDQAASESRAATARLLQDWVAAHGSSEQHPFFGAQARSLLPMELSEVRGALEGAAAALHEVENLRSRLEGALVEMGATAAEVERAVLGLKRAAEAPDLTGVAFVSGLWKEHQARLREGLERGQRLAEVHARLDAALTPEAWQAPVTSWRRDLEEHRGKLWRGLIGPYRAARRGTLGLYRERTQASDEALTELLGTLEEEAGDRRALEPLDGLLKSLLGSRWQGMATDFAAAAGVTDWMTETASGVDGGQLPPWTLDLVARGVDLGAEARTAENLGRLLWEARGHLDLVARLLRFPGGADTWLAGPLAETRTRLQLFLTQLHTLPDLLAFHRYADEARSTGLEPLLDLLGRWDAAPTQLVEAVRQKWLDAVIRAALHERPALASFDGARHEAEIGRFRQLDERHLHGNRDRVLRAHLDRSDPSAFAAQWKVLNRQFGLKIRHKAIRALMGEAGQAIQQLTPVFMMGPLSVANHLPRGTLDFDLVIFDEASQIRPEEGLGSVARGRQVVVVGDEKQLPPSTFFVGQDGDGDGTDGDGGSQVADLESLLGVFAAANAPQRMLHWHYRSRHQSLIAVSNSEFYDNRLVLFPSREVLPSATGLIYHHLPHAFYDYGKSRTNRGEARGVAEAVMRHARETPELSLGVAAFSAAQADAILDEVEALRRMDPSAEPFFDAGRPEPFFVKNLENVQGDERDVIHISVGYGRQESGKLSLNFGPLNKAGGERRMNVLISRAKLRCEVFTNLRAEDIDLGATASAGMRVLKTFLHYAATGRLEVPQETGAEADSPFEDAVERALKGLGYDVRRQIGSGGYRVDLAIVDAAQPGRYLLGIECDGATYHRSRSARDRDRLRQQVLENLGWRIHRIWSTDWFLNPHRCLQALVGAVEQARVQAEAP